MATVTPGFIVQMFAKGESESKSDWVIAAREYALYGLPRMRRKMYFLKWISSHNSGDIKFVISIIPIIELSSNKTAIILP